MKLQQLLEGMWIVKNRDGKEKRFKDDNSPEARAWAASSSPVKKRKAAKYSDDWWHDNLDHDGPPPWDKFVSWNVTDSAAYKQFVSELGEDVEVFNFRIGPIGYKKVGETTVATAKMVVSYSMPNTNKSQKMDISKLHPDPEVQARLKAKQPDSLDNGDEPDKIGRAHV